MSKKNLPDRRAVAYAAAALVLCPFILAIAAMWMQDGRKPSYVSYLFWLFSPFLIGCFFIAVAFLNKKNFWVYFFIICGSLFFAFGAGEISTRLLPTLANPGNTDDSANSVFVASGMADGTFYFEPDELLGYAHPKQRKLAHRKIHGDDLVYDILCSLDKYGNRETPYRPAAQHAVLLFGDSFTFGDGLQDNETFAYELSSLLGSSWQVINYGVSGYGAHQTLGLIESGKIDFDALKSRYARIEAYFLTIRDHPRRACKYFSFGPAYESENGEVKYRGQLPLSRGDRLAWLIHASTLTETFYPILVDAPAIDLHVDILKNCSDMLKKYGIRFTVIVWPDFIMLEDRLRSAGVGFISLKETFGLKDGQAWDATPDRWRVSRWDRHPNAAAAKVIARAIEQNLSAGRQSD